MRSEIHFMRWLLYIPSILVLLTLGLELCSSHAAADAKAPSHLALILDDDDAEVKQGLDGKNSLTECDSFIFAGASLMPRCLKTGLVLPPHRAAVVQVCPGVRLHRWLCRECC